MDHAALHKLQLELECKGLDDDGRLVRIPGDEPDDLELVQLTRNSAGTHRILVSRDASDDFVDRLERLSAKAAYEDPGLVVSALGGKTTTWERGCSYVFFPDLSAPPNVVRVMPEVDAACAEPWTRRPMFVVFADGEQACFCRSSRENNRAAEAWVETFPPYRRRGFARDAVAAWACSVRDAGKVAFYSHREDNLASAGVARSLGLQQWLTYINFEAASE